MTAFCPWTNRLETVESTDPYSRGLAANGERSLLVNLGDPDVTPGGWGRHPLPSLGAWSDISVYELHVRDFRCGCLTACDLACVCACVCGLCFDTCACMLWRTRLPA